MTYSKREYRVLFNFWKRKGYATFDNNFHEWLKWAMLWEDGFKEAQFKEYKEDKMCNLLAACIAPAPCKTVPFQTGTKTSMVITDDIVVQETGKKMYKDERTEAQQAKDYLIDSLREVIRSKELEAYKAFNMEYVGPKNLGDIRQAVKNGWMQVGEQFKELPDSYHVYGWLDVIEVQDPERKRDPEGYKKAKEAIRKAASDVKDQIVVMGPEKGLEALNAYKAQTFH